MESFFIDYYKVLDVKIEASQDEIKNAYRKAALLNHPDRNRNTDTTRVMQEINEAYLILGDSNIRPKYDAEYRRYLEFINKESNKNNTSNSSTGKNYTILNKDLSSAIKTAKHKASTIVKEAAIDLKGMLSEGAKTGAKQFKDMMVAWIIGGIIMYLFITIASCGGN
ncbi:J domain-containing protein [bacterium]|nr:J domain-containing protein [bacterium]